MRSEAIAPLNMLDSPPEPEFNDLVNLAALIYEVPIAFISLVDRKCQQFKARIGSKRRRSYKEPGTHKGSQP